MDREKNLYIKELERENKELKKKIAMTSTNLVKLLERLEAEKPPPKIKEKKPVYSESDTNSD